MGGHIIHAIYNWLHNIDITLLFFMFLILGDEAGSAVCTVIAVKLCICLHVFPLSLHMLQDVGVLPQPAECQFFSGEDGSRAETTESHQPSAK